jgi:hypothetical protein
MDFTVGANQLIDQWQCSASAIIPATFTRGTLSIEPASTSIIFFNLATPPDSELYADLYENAARVEGGR